MGILIEIPNRGYVDLDAFRINKKVNEYDERLFFEYIPQERLWGLFIKMEHGSEPYLIRRFSNIPTEEEIMGFIKRADSRLRGVSSIWESHVKGLMKERSKNRSEYEESREAVAEAIESWARNQGNLRYWKSFSKEYESRKKR